MMTRDYELIDSIEMIEKAINVWILQKTVLRTS